VSTAVDTAFEEILSAGDAAEELHLVCGICFPQGPVFRPAIALCGYRTRGVVLDPAGRHRCARCLPWEERSPLPCGHP
jgi:hypothetical protein